jgi:hypothetical protein
MIWERIYWVPLRIFTIVAVPLMPLPLTTIPTSSPTVLATVTVVTPLTVLLVDASSFCRSSAWV